MRNNGTRLNIQSIFWRVNSQGAFYLPTTPPPVSLPNLNLKFGLEHMPRAAPCCSEQNSVLDWLLGCHISTFSLRTFTGCPLHTHSRYNYAPHPSCPSGMPYLIINPFPQGSSRGHSPTISSPVIGERLRPSPFPPNLPNKTSWSLAERKGGAGRKTPPSYTRKSMSPSSPQRKARRAGQAG